MPLLKPSVTDWGKQLSQEVFCSACKVVTVVLFTENKFNVRGGWLHGGSGLPTVWEPFLMGFVWWLELKLRVCFAPTRLCFVYIYSALQHFNIIYKTKTGQKQAYNQNETIHAFFSHEHQKYSQAFFQRTRPPVSFMYRHSSLACSHVLSHYCVCVHTTTILTLWTT